MKFPLILSLLSAGVLPLVAQGPDPFGVGGLLGGGAKAEAGPEVKASLVAAADGVVPGGTVTVALKLEHAAHWHTYWVNPGLGTATTIRWTLPEGFSAGPIVWPMPEALETEVGNQHVYGGTVYLLTEIRVPAGLKAGETVTPGERKSSRPRSKTSSSSSTLFT